MAVPPSLARYAIACCIRFGVTGSRKLPSTDLLKTQVESILSDRYLEAFTDTARQQLLSLKSTPLIMSIISPLAAGADQLVAEVGLSLPGCRLEVVLPFERAAYLERLGSPEAIQGFERLEKAAHRVHLPPRGWLLCAERRGARRGLFSRRGAGCR